MHRRGNKQGHLCKYAASHTELFSGWTIEGLSLEEHLLKMKPPGAWGSHLEIKAAATLFNKTIYVASDSLVAGECRWQAFSPFSVTNQRSSSTIPVVNQKHWLEIAYSNQCHYDGVRPMRTDVPPIPPALTGTTSFVKTIL